MVVVLVEEVVDEVGVGPVDTTIVTVEPLAACVPADGLVLMTVLAGTEAEACVVVFTLNPATPSALDAAVAVMPVTSGMATCATPLDTLICTTEFFVAVVLAAGLCEMT